MSPHHKQAQHIKWVVPLCKGQMFIEFPYVKDNISFQRKSKLNLFKLTNELYLKLKIEARDAIS